jgi:lipoprotein-anchoring transpeptidase ErfK/SrfK
MSSKAVVAAAIALAAGAALVITGPAFATGTPTPTPAPRPTATAAPRPTATPAPRPTVRTPQPISSREAAAIRARRAAAIRTTAGPSVRRRARRPRRWLVTVAASLVLLGTGCSSTRLAGPEVVSAPGTATASATNSNAVGAAVPSGSSLVATARGAQVVVRAAPGGAPKHTMANPTSIGAPLTFLVLDRRPGWLEVAVPIRPNGSSGWVSQADVTLSITPYRLVISMAEHRLDVEYEGRRIARHPVGVGKVATPTPTGTYFVTELIQPPNPAGAYGPYAFGLSAFSNTLKTFAGGPGQLGLHGTDVPKGLGHDVSHGCLRVSNAVITQLAGQIPLGTPVDIRT